LRDAVEVIRRSKFGRPIQPRGRNGQVRVLLLYPKGAKERDGRWQRSVIPPKPGIFFSICQAAKDPPPWRERLSLPARGHHEILIHQGADIDRYTLNVEPGWFELSPSGKPRFSHLVEIRTGRFLRPGRDWFWIGINPFGTTAEQPLADRRDRMLRELAALGATPFVPPDGRYLLNGWPVHLHGRPGTAFELSNVDGIDRRFFHWTGDLSLVDDIVARQLAEVPIVPYRDYYFDVTLERPGYHLSSYALKQSSAAPQRSLRVE